MVQVLAADEIQDKPEAGYAMRSLRDRVEDARSERILKKSPRGLPEIVIHFAPLTEAERSRVLAKKRPKAEERLLQNADIIVLCCRGIYEVSDGDEQTSGSLLDVQTDYPMRFGDDRLASLLGVEEQADLSGATVRALFATDGDIIGLGDEIVLFSGYGGEELAEAIQGNS